MSSHDTNITFSIKSSCCTKNQRSRTKSLLKIKTCTTQVSYKFLPFSYYKKNNNFQKRSEILKYGF